jgi:hypothetical protein
MGIFNIRSRDLSSGWRQHGRGSALLADTHHPMILHGSPLLGFDYGRPVMRGIMDPSGNVLRGCFRDRSQLAQHPCCKLECPLAAGDLYAVQGSPRRESEQEYSIVEVMQLAGAYPWALADRRLSQLNRQGMNVYK